jgi:hypothetical protein
VAQVTQALIMVQAAAVRQQPAQAAQAQQVSFM